jgi:hypothetical protein
MAKLKYLDQQKGRGGKPSHWYVRRNGRRFPLPGRSSRQRGLLEDRRDQ